MSIKKVKTQLLFLSLITLSIYSCKKDSDSSTTIPDATISNTTVYFQNDVLPIFQSSCAMNGCHNSTNKVDGYDLSNYDAILSKGITKGNYKSSKIYTEIANGAMPPRGYTAITSTQLNSIASWIQQGALNNITNTTSDLNNITYSQSVKPILDTYCKGCHSSSLASGGISYQDYANTQITANNGKLLGSIQQLSANYKAMPQGGNKLSDNTIAIIQKWINNGSPNN